MPSRPGRIRASAAAIPDLVLGLGPVVRIRTILARYDAAGGGLLAAGLAYAALFALVPGVLLLLGLAGLLIDDADDRARLISAVGEAMPPVRGLLEISLEQLSREARSISLVGLVGLAWGVSRFYLALEGALARVLSDGRRGFFHRLLMGFGSVLILIAAGITAIVVAGLLSVVELWLPFLGEEGPGETAVLIVGTAAGVALTALALALVYRVVPPGYVAWRPTIVPSVMVAIVLAVLTRLFVLLAPRLIGAAAVLGTLATVFAALAWLALSFQAILLGAAWIADREVRRREHHGELDRPGGGPPRAPW